MSAFASFGIIGYGHFGQLIGGSLATAGEVLVHDPDPAVAAQVTADHHPVRVAPLAEVAGCDVVILAVPFAALSEVLALIRPLLGSTTVVMDVVSTKATVTERLGAELGDHPNLLATHPLFGPPSMTELAPGQRLVVTFQRGERAAAFLAMLRRAFGLEIVEVSPDEHDRAMAYMQSLPFFIARALVDIGLLELPDKERLGIPSFEKLASIAAIEQHHTHEMFETSQLSNPYARQARLELLDALRRLQKELDGE